ncbi:MAG: hypothetical protein H7Z73_05460 [Candidatus Saccharibacteria bacterium]|nr:hypothetical protein [Moraxellaceae bacterium]
MLNKGLEQKATDGGTAVQAGRDVIIIAGIDEKRAREIYQEMILQLRREYSQEALDIANTRVTEFENRLMPKMEEVKGAVEAFADPSFQLLLCEAQKTAAATERPADYDILSELLLHRFLKGGNRFIRAGINRAVEIVDEISDDALLGLTVFHAVSTFTPLSGDLHQGLNVLDNLFGKLFYGKLPTGKDWLDHLDLLDAVRINSFGSVKTIQDYYPETLAGYVDIGIEKNSGDYEKAVEILNKNNVSQTILVDHAFNNNFMRLNIAKKAHTSHLLLQQSMPNNPTVFFQTPLSEEQRKALDSIYELYKQDSNMKQQYINLFMEEWNKRPNLKMLREWWDNIGTAVQITAVGKVLAHSNAQRCDKTLPPMD